MKLLFIVSPFIPSTPVRFLPAVFGKFACKAFTSAGSSPISSYAASALVQPIPKHSDLFYTDIAKFAYSKRLITTFLNGFLSTVPLFILLYIRAIMAHSPFTPLFSSLHFSKCPALFPCVGLKSITAIIACHDLCPLTFQIIITLLFYFSPCYFRKNWGRSPRGERDWK